MAVNGINGSVNGNAQGVGLPPGLTNRLGEAGQTDLTAVFAAELRKFLQQNPQAVLNYLQQANPYVFQLYAPAAWVTADPLALAELVLYGKPRDKTVTTRTSVDVTPDCRPGVVNRSGGHASGGTKTGNGVGGVDSKTQKKVEMSGAWAKDPKSGKDIFVPQPPNRAPGPGSGRGAWVEQTNGLAWAKSDAVSEGRWQRNQNGKLEWRPPKDLEDAFRSNKADARKKATQETGAKKGDDQADKVSKTEKADNGAQGAAAHA